MDAKTEQEVRIKKNTIVSPKQQPPSKTGFFSCNDKNRELIAKHVDSFKGVIQVIDNSYQAQPKARTSDVVNDFTGA